MIPRIKKRKAVNLLEYYLSPCFYTLSPVSKSQAQIFDPGVSRHGWLTLGQHSSHRIQRQPLTISVIKPV